MGQGSAPRLLSFVLVYLTRFLCLNRCTKGSAPPEGYEEMKMELDRLKKQQRQLENEQEAARQNEEQMKRELMAREEANEQKINSLAKELDEAKMEIREVKKGQQQPPSNPKPVPQDDGSEA